MRSRASVSSLSWASAGAAASSEPGSAAAPASAEPAAEELAAGRAHGWPASADGRAHHEGVGRDLLAEGVADRGEGGGVLGDRPVDRLRESRA